MTVSSAVMAQPFRLTDPAENPLNVQTDGPSLVAYTSCCDYDNNGNLIYQGWSLSSHAGKPPATSMDCWAIRRYTYTKKNQVMLTQWANGNTLANNVWDNRATLNYQ